MRAGGYRDAPSMPRAASRRVRRSRSSTSRRLSARRRRMNRVAPRMPTGSDPTASRRLATAARRGAVRKFRTRSESSPLTRASRSKTGSPVSIPSSPTTLSIAVRGATWRPGGGSTAVVSDSSTGSTANQPRSELSAMTSSRSVRPSISPVTLGSPWSSRSYVSLCARANRRHTATRLRERTRVPTATSTTTAATTATEIMSASDCSIGGTMDETRAGTGRAAR